MDLFIKLLNFLTAFLQRPLLQHPRRFSIVEQVGMGSCAGEFQGVAVDPVEQEPIRFDVQIPVALPIAFKGMIVVTGG